MTADTRPLLSRLWRPNGLPERGPLLVYHRLSGRWKGFNRQVVHRSDHPRKFWVWATFGVAATAICFAAACFLTWMLADPSGWF